MKKLNKFEVNPLKLLKNNELLTLKGGYGTTCCTCYSGGTPIGDVLATNDYMCNQNCINKYGPSARGVYLC